MNHLPSPRVPSVESTPGQATSPVRTDDAHAVRQRTDLPAAADSRRRAAWRQRLVEAERGMTHGFRSDSTLFVHFFVATLIIAAALVLGISLAQWTVLILALTLVLSAELFNQVLKTLLRESGPPPDETAQKALRIATAGVLVAILGATATILLIFGQRLMHLFAR